MSDEPRKGSRAWARVAWALTLVLVLYPLSMGPFEWLALRSGRSQAHIEKTWARVYAPIEWLRWKSETVDGAVVQYLSWWAW